MGESIFSWFISSEIHIRNSRRTELTNEKAATGSPFNQTFSVRQAHSAEHFLELRSEWENQEWGHPGKVGNYQQLDKLLDD